MNRSRIVIAAICLLFPGLLTVVWFYSGVPKTGVAQMPDFPTIDVPRAPISTPVQRNTPSGDPSTSVLFDMSHGNLVSLAEIDPLVRAIESRGGAIHTTGQETFLADSLKSANAYVSLAPFMAFSAAERSDLKAFVKRGGKILIAADPTRNQMIMTEGAVAQGVSGIDAVNLVLEPFDISISDDYLYDMVSNEGNYRNVIFTEFSKSDLTKGMEKLVVYGGHSVHSNGNPLVTSSGTTYSSDTDQPGSISPFSLVQSGKGSVLTLGDLSLLTTQYFQSADNQIFVQNIAGYLVDGEREKTLADFPRILSKQIAIQPAGELTMDGSLISGISNLERAMDIMPGGLSITENPSLSIDRIVLSTFDESEENKMLLEKLEINLSPEPRVKETETPIVAPTQKLEATPIAGNELLLTQFPEADYQNGSGFNPPEKSKDIEIPGIGYINTKNLGLVGLIREDKRTTLIIMADSSETIKSFMDGISMSGLNGCLLQENLAVCNVGGGMMINPVQPKG